jgi:hypothetical protein
MKTITIYEVKTIQQNGKNLKVELESFRDSQYPDDYSIFKNGNTIYYDYFTNKENAINYFNSLNANEKVKNIK